METIGKVVLIAKGTYSSSATYNHLDWVRYNGKSWVCKQDNVTNVTPVEGNTWTVIAQDGATGTTDAEILIRDTVGWTGKNIAPIHIDTIKRLNTTGTWSGNTVTYSTLSFAFSTDADGYVTKITVNGYITSGSINLYLTDDMTSSNSLVLNGCPSGGGNSVYKLLATNSGGSSLGLNEDYGNGASLGVISSVFRIQIRVYSGAGTLSNKDFYPMLRDSSINNATFEPHHETVEQTLRDAEVIESANILDLVTTTRDWETKTNSGVTCTNRHDGTFGLGGTASDANINNWFYGGYNTGKTLFVIKAGSYAISDVMIFNPSGGRIGPTVLINGEPQTFTLNADTNVGGVRCASAVNATNYDGKVLKPMLCYADEDSYAFTPYYIPLKDSKFDRSENDVLGAKNLLPFPYHDSTKTVNDVTFTVNDDGSVTVNGTASAATAFSLASSYTINEDFIFTGCPQNGSNSTYKQQAWDFNTSTTENQFGDGVKLKKGHKYNIEIVIANGYHANNLVFYPMLSLSGGAYAPYAMTNRQLTDKLAVTESAVTNIISGASVTNDVMGNHLYKSGNVVEFRLSLRYITASAWTTLASIPDGYRPQGNTNPVTIYDHRCSKFFNIAPSGSIQCHSALSNEGCDLHATWIAK